MVSESDRAKPDQELEEEEDEIPFNWWIDTNPKIKQRIAKAAKASKAEEALEEARQMILDLVQARFPAQLLLAQQHITVLTKPAQLRKLMLDIVGAPDEAAVLVLLTENVSKQAIRRKNQSARQP